MKLARLRQNLSGRLALLHQPINFDIDAVLLKIDGLSLQMIVCALPWDAIRLLASFLPRFGQL